MNIKKICGITSLKDAKMVASYFPHYLGFVFHKESTRNISLKKIQEISSFLKTNFKKNCPSLVGVFVNPTIEFIQKISSFVDVFQFHGEESPEFCKKISQNFPNHKVWKALRIQKKTDIDKILLFEFCDGILLDSFSENQQGGTGKKIPSEIFSEIKIYTTTRQDSHQIVLIAGGINDKNFKEILKKTGASGVDLSSSLEEKKGKKSEIKVREFFYA